MKAPVNRFRSPGDVALRSLQLALLCLRGEYEQALWIGASREEMGAIWGMPWVEWARGWGLERTLSEPERLLCGKAPGSWAEKERIDASWSSEALGALLWAGGHLQDFPGPEELLETPALLVRMPLMMDPTEFIRGARLIQEADLTRAFREVDLWRWRAGVHRAMALKVPPPEGWDWPRLVRVTLVLANEEGLLPEPQDDDFPCCGMPFRDLDGDTVALVASAATERLRALSWVLGYTRSWEELPGTSASGFPENGLFSTDASREQEQS